MHETAPITSQGRRFRRLGSPFRLALLAGLLAACAACQPVQAVSEVAPAGERWSLMWLLLPRRRTDDSSEALRKSTGPTQR